MVNNKVNNNDINGKGSRNRVTRMIRYGDNYDTATYTFATADNGVASFGMLDFSAEDLDIDVSDGAVAYDESEGALEIISSGIDHFRISSVNQR